MSFNIEDVINFGKNKGQTWESLARTPEGVGYIKWITGQPAEGKYKNANMARNKVLLELLGEPSPQLEQMEETNADLSGFSKQLIDVTMRITAVEATLATMEANQKWTEA